MTLAYLIAFVESLAHEAAMFTDVPFCEARG